MTFSKFACWNSDMLGAVMDVEATHPPEHLFLATHHPISMYRQDLIEGTSKIEYTEEQFLRDFLGPPDFSFVPVLGTSGTGKSHLIRWLYIRIKRLKRDDPSCKVLLIPKVGTNLKSIIESILKGMVGQEFDEYRSRLRSTSNSMSEEEACRQLLANLAIAVGRSGQTALIRQGFEDIIDGLPALLDDPYFKREYWLKENGIISRLVTHTLGRRDAIEDVEERREFITNDLPQSFREVQDASKEARDFYRNLVGDDETQHEVVRWLNLHLDEAIAKVLNLGREDLQRLMLDVRRALAKQGVELILLIEDFAKLQGIDREVLESVLARPQQVNGEPLCAMRTSLACTTGYFKGLVDTVRTRTSFSVNLDIEIVSDQSLVNQEDIQGLVAKYLNATRLNNRVIQEWAESFDEETRQPSQSFPNACSECPHVSACHEGFGHEENMGLYPFTQKALKRMHERVNKGVFNPRILIKEILRHTLEYHRNEIEQGLFPSSLLHQHFGGSDLSAMLSNDIEGRDTRDNASRRKVLIDLWTDGNSLCDLHPSIHQAFNLPMLGVETRTHPPKITAKSIDSNYLAIPSVSPEIIDEESFPPSSLVNFYEAINNWQNGDRLLAEVGQELRTLLLEPIIQRIDWNSELIIRQKVGKRFDKAGNITFINSTRRIPSGIELHLPLNPDNPQDFRDTAISLQALLLYNYYGNWKFSNGTKYFCIYAKKLEEWSQYVLDSIHKSVRKSEELWNPVPAAAELLMIGSRMVGRSSESEEALLNGIFKDFTEAELDVSSRSSSWRKVFASIKEKRSELLDIVQSRIACTKGNSTRLQIIDTSQLLKTLNTISKDWQPKCNIPDDLRSEYEVISKVRQKIDEFMENGVIEERDRQLRIYLAMVQELGDEFSQKDVVVNLNDAIASAKYAGVTGISNTQNIENAVDEFGKLRIKSYMENMKKIQGETNVGLLIEKLSSTSYSQRTMDVIENFLKQGREFLDKSIARAKNDITNLPSSGDLESSYEAIELGLSDLKNLAVEIKGDTTSCS
jgi:hypothetical protein